MKRLLAGAGAVASLLVALAAPGAAHGSVVWLCKPGQADNPCDVNMDTTVQDAAGGSRVLTPRKPARPPVDCFYVYPTASNQTSLNATKAKDPDVRAFVAYEVARFGLKCRVFTPVYRQLTLGFVGGSPQDQRRAYKTAYADVREAWLTYLVRYNKGRGVVLIGHSQGARLLVQLMREKIDKRPAQLRRLVSAILLGANVSVREGSDRGGDFDAIPACRRPAQVGCVVAFSTFDEDPPANSRYGRTPTDDGLGQGRPFGPQYEVLCTNPASLDANARRPLTTLLTSGPFPGLIGTLTGVQWGGARPSAPTTFVQPADRYTGRCETRNGANVLRLEPRGAARHLTPTPDPSWGLHLEDAVMALGDLVGVVGRQARAWEG